MSSSPAPSTQPVEGSDARAHKIIARCVALKLSGVARALVQLLLVYENKTGQPTKAHLGLSWPSVDRLADDSGFARNTVKRALEELVSSGLVQRIQTRRGQCPTFYRVVSTRNDPTRAFEPLPSRRKPGRMGQQRTHTEVPLPSSMGQPVTHTAARESEPMGQPLTHTSSYGSNESAYGSNEGGRMGQPLTPKDRLDAQRGKTSSPDAAGAASGDPGVEKDPERPPESLADGAAPDPVYVRASTHSNDERERVFADVVRWCCSAGLIRIAGPATESPEYLTPIQYRAELGLPPERKRGRMRSALDEHEAAAGNEAAS